MYCTGPGGLAPGECVQFLQPGSACDPMVIEMCGENGSCVCDDAACSAHHCDIYLRKGDACGAGRVCGAGQACVSGICELIVEPYGPADCP